MALSFLGGSRAVWLDRLHDLDDRRDHHCAYRNRDSPCPLLSKNSRSFDRSFRCTWDEEDGFAHLPRMSFARVRKGRNTINADSVDPNESGCSWRLPTGLSTQIKPLSPLVKPR